MSFSDDFLDDMEELPFDDTDADAVFGSSPGSESVPAELRDVAELVHVARSTGAAGELAGEDVMVAQIAAAVGEHLAPQRGDADERIHVLRKFRTVKLTAAATAVLMLGATAAAAATGTLPAPVQSSVDKSLSGVGIDLPAQHHAELTAKHATPKGVAGALHRGHRAGPKHTGPKHTGPNPTPGAAGTVASVNGSSAPTACGALATAGSFTLTGRKGATFTVNVTSATTFFQKGTTGASFANVCVGTLVFAKGTVAGTTVGASSVAIATARHQDEHHHGVFGTVASVNGVSTAGTCGTGNTGAFTIAGMKGAGITVNIGTATKFRAFGGVKASFVNVCVGAKVGVEGDVSGTIVTAAGVFVLPVHQPWDHDRNGTHKGKHHFPKGFMPHGNPTHGTDHKGGDDHHGSGPRGPHEG